MKYERFKELQNKVLEEQRKEELEFLKESVKFSKDYLQQIIKRRIKQLEATK